MTNNYGKCCTVRWWRFVCVADNWLHDRVPFSVQPLCGLHEWLFTRDDKRGRYV